MSSATAAAELIDFAEAAGPFMEPAPGRLLRVTDRYTLAGEIGHTWAAVERIRLRGHEIGEAVADVDAFMREAGNARASWWLTERSTPADLEERLLAVGCRREESDYLHAGMVLTRGPPAVDGVEARGIASLEEFV